MMSEMECCALVFTTRFVRSGIRSVFFLLPLLSCTWMFAEYSVITRNLLTQLLFAVSNTLLVSD